MVRYWMFIINDKNFKVVKNKNIIGSNYQNKIDKINENDVLIFYIKNPHCTINAIGKVASKYQDNKTLFEGGLYNYRLKIKSLEVFEKPFDIREIIAKLNFLTNKSKWQLHLFGSRGIREIPESDFELIKDFANIN